MNNKNNHHHYGLNWNHQSMKYLFPTRILNQKFDFSWILNTYHTNRLIEKMKIFFPLNKSHFHSMMMMTVSEKMMCMISIKSRCDIRLIDELSCLLIWFKYMHFPLHLICSLSIPIWKKDGSKQTFPYSCSLLLLFDGGKMVILLEFFPISKPDCLIRKSSFATFLFWIEKIQIGWD